MKASWQKKISRGLILLGVALLMFCCWLGFIAHAWVGDSVGTSVSGLLFLLAPLLAWKAWRGSVVAGASISAFTLLIIWLPPWVIAPRHEMIISSVIVIAGAVSFLRLSGKAKADPAATAQRP